MENHKGSIGKHLPAWDEKAMGINWADVAELVDARDLKSLDGNVVWVRVPPPAPIDPSRIHIRRATDPPTRNASSAERVLRTECVSRRSILRSFRSRRLGHLRHALPCRGLEAWPGFHPCRLGDAGWVRRGQHRKAIGPPFSS